MDLFEEITGKREDVKQRRISERRRNLPVFRKRMCRVCLEKGKDAQ